MSISRRLLKRIVFLSTWHRYALALVVGLLAALAAWSKSPGAAEAIAGWDGFALTMIVIGWARIVTSSPAVVVRVADVQHSSRLILLTVMLGGACASLGAVAFLLATKGGSHTKALPASALLAAGTVVCSWVLVHTMLTMHYAYLYYRTPGSRRVQARPRGLLFPGQGSPDYLDFAYFSFIIGMTSQVSDVAIASREIRRWALLHGLIAFAFNAAIVAVSVNVISGVFGAG